MTEKQESNSTPQESVKTLDDAGFNKLIKSFFSSDLLAGMGTAFFVSPFVTTIDKAVVEFANGKSKTIREGLMKGWKIMLTNPRHYFTRKEYLLVFGVYTQTFWMANNASSYADAYGLSKEKWRFLATVCVNIPGSVMQDRMFTRWFGVVKTGIPALTYGCFTVRDMMTCATSFSLPLIIAKALGISLIAVTLCLPTMTQFLSSPLHLLGQDLYNRKTATWKERRVFLKQNYLRTTGARIGRIGPTFGIGSNLNNYLRSEISSRI